MSYTKTCAYCGKAFETPYHNAKLCPDCRHGPCEVCDKTFKRQLREGKRLQRFCSRECLAIAQNWGPETEERECIICGRAFTVERGDWERKTCSDECLHALRSINAKELMRDYHLENSTELECKWCGKKFRRKNSHVREHNFCSQECRGKWRTEQGTVTLICENCGKEFVTTNGQVEHRAARFCSVECANDTLSREYRGENNPNWKGGDSVSDYGPNWERQKRRTRKRDNDTCQICGYQHDGTRILDVHHIIPLKMFEGNWRSANKLSNLVTLCRNCHAAIEAGNITYPLSSSSQPPQ